jgi:hypothetical protein
MQLIPNSGWQQTILYICSRFDSMQQLVFILCLKWILLYIIKFQEATKVNMFYLIRTRTPLLLLINHLANAA